MLSMATKKTKKIEKQSFLNKIVKFVSSKNLLIPNFVTSLMILLLILSSYFVGYLAAENKYLKLGGAELKKADSDLLELVSGKLGINKKKFSSCIKESEISDLVKADVSSATNSGVAGTPGAFVVNLETGAIIQLLGAVGSDMSDDEARALVDAGSLLPEQIEQVSIMGAVRKVQSGDPSVPFEKELLMPTDSDRIEGNKDANIALIVYSDYECPYCAVFHKTASDLIKTNNDIMYVFRHFPLEQLHPDSYAKAVASECVNKLGGNENFWAFTDLIFNK